MTHQELADFILGIEVCMMTTVDGRGSLHSRPMRNNQTSRFDGNCYFFTQHDASKVSQLQHSARISIAYHNEADTYLQIYGRGYIVTDADTKRKHWHDKMAQWFDVGPESDELVMIRVAADRVRYWIGKENGEVKLS